MAYLNGEQVFLSAVKGEKGDDPVNVYVDGDITDPSCSIFYLNTSSLEITLSDTINYIRVNYSKKAHYLYLSEMSLINEYTNKNSAGHVYIDIQQKTLIISNNYHADADLVYCGYFIMTNKIEQTTCKLPFTWDEKYYYYPKHEGREKASLTTNSYWTQAAQVDFTNRK